MKHSLIITATVFTWVSFSSFAQNVYTTKTGEISFFSKTPVEDIDAHNKKVGSVLKTTTNEIMFVISVNQFEFQKSLMQEHFNENYMESEKYPLATFNGKINPDLIGIDFTKDGVYSITATGKLKIHGVEQTRTEKGTLTIKNGFPSLHCAMKVKLKDFNIEIPKLVFQKIAEEIDVKINAAYTPYTKEEKK